MTDLPETVDVTAPRDVEIRIREDGRVIWINIDGLCRLRACQISKLTLCDDRQPKQRRRHDDMVLWGGSLFGLW